MSDVVRRVGRGVLICLLPVLMALDAEVTLASDRLSVRFPQVT